MSASRFFKAWCLYVAIFSIIASSALAAEFAGGTGEPNDPYQIASAEDLMLLGESPEDYDKHFILTADIDLNPNLPGRKVFDKTVIGAAWETPFAGVFDGNVHTISNFNYNSTDTDNIGLFGYVRGENAQIKNLGLLNPNIDAGKGDYVGSLVGFLYGGTITACYAESGSVSGNGYVGGLVGDNRQGTIFNCHASGYVIGEYKLGGLVGRNREGIIINCYANTSVSGGHSSSCIGGLVGDNAMTTDVHPIPGTSSGWIFNSYAAGSVSGGDDSSCLGGLVGYFGDGSIINSFSTAKVIGGKKSTGLGGLVGEISTILGDSGGWVANCYATGYVTAGEDSLYLGGLVGGIGHGCVNNSLWDTETTGQTTSDGGTGKTTTEMQDINTYLTAGWDFIDEIANGTSEIWRMPENGGYPVLTIFQGYTPTLPDGHGTAEEPFLITNVRELGSVGYYPLACYRLDANIDLSEIVWTTAVIPWFGGHFDGNSHVLLNLSVQGCNYLGLFGILNDNAVVKDLGIEGVSIQGMGDFIGGLVGDNSGQVSNCYSSGAIGGSSYVGGSIGCNEGAVINCHSAGTVSGEWKVGGLVGGNSGDQMSQCYSTSVVDGNDYVGGLVGANHSTVTYCYCNGVVSGDTNVGGLVGFNSYNVIQCYSTSNVNGNDFVGGLVGYIYDAYGAVAQCYSTGAVLGSKDNVGGLVGQNYEGAVIESLWNIETSGQTTSDGGIGKTTAEMQTASTFLDAGWDFVDETDNGTDDIWKMPPWTGYPLLAWQEVEIPAPAPIAHWAFDKGSGDVAADSAGDNHGTIYNPEWVEGKINGALQFNGFNTYVDCGDSELLGPEQMTLALWLEPGHMGGMRYILSRSNISTDGIDYTLTRLLTGQVEFTVGQLNTVSVSVLSNSTTPLNEWSHVAVSMDGSESSVYINGQLDASAGYAERGPRQGHRLVLSSYQGSTRFYFGKLDDARIYDTALSEDDIEALYTDGSQ
jgi:hypothetical protein